MLTKIGFLTEFVTRHRGKIAAGATATVFIALMIRNRNVLTEFLKEHGLEEEYYKLED